MPAISDKRFRMESSGVLRREIPAQSGAKESPGFEVSVPGITITTGSVPSSLRTQTLAMATVGAAALMTFGLVMAEGQIIGALQPTPVSAVFDDSDGFGALDNALDVEIFNQGGRTYAIVTAAADDDGVQIIDITNPVQPAPVSAVFDGSGGFGALDDARDVEVFNQSGRTYAIVAAGVDDSGVQIIDITNPVQPAPVSAVFDGSGGFGALDDALDVDIFTHGNGTYAIVAARNDNGVQIIDITNPAHPTPVSAVFDDSDGFLALAGAYDVDIFTHGNGTYAIVAAGVDDDGVQIMDITNPAHPTPVSAVFDGPDGFSALDGASAVKVFTQGDHTYAIVTARYDDGVQIMDITNPAHPTPVSAVFDGPGRFSALDGAYDVEIFTQGGRTYAVIAAGIGDDGVQIMDITNPAHPTPVSAVFDDSDGFSALDGAFDVEVFTQGDHTYAIVAAWADDGVQIMDITPRTLNLAHGNLAGEDLIGADLSGTNLRYANLQGAILIGADLTNTDLTGASLHDAILIDANLRYANLTGADLTDAHLAGASMVDAHLMGANLTLSNLRDADLTGADLSNVAMSFVNLARANLTGTNLQGADLSGANMFGANLTDTNLTNANLCDANLQGVDLTDAKDVDTSCN